MANIIREQMEDGTVYEFDVDVCGEVAAEALDVLLEAQDEVEKFDFATGVLCLFMESVHILTASGWTVQELVNEVFNHSELARRESAEATEAAESANDTDDTDEEDSDENTVTVSVSRGSSTLH